MWAGLDAYLILRTTEAAVNKDPGLTGNLLLERLAGARVELITKQEYAAHGSVALLKSACAAL